MAQLTDKQITALQTRLNFWSKKEFEAIEADDAEAVEAAGVGKAKVLTEAQAAKVALIEWEPETEAAPATTTTTKTKDTTPKSVKESAAVAEKKKKVAAAKAATTEPGATKAKVARVKKEKVLQPCLDGCGEMVPGNFKMGHDAKLKSLILKVERGEVDQSEIPDIAQDLVTFKKGELSVEKDSKGKEKSRTQTYIVTKAPVRFNGRPEITLTTR